MKEYQALEDRINKIGVGLVLTDLGMGSLAVAGSVVIAFGLLLDNENFMDLGLIGTGIGLTYKLGKYIGKKLYGEK